MTTVKVPGGIDILRLPVDQQTVIYHPWTIKTTKSHILHSSCSKNETGCSEDQRCQFCRFNDALHMPHMPDMVFPNNILNLKHTNGAVLEFNAFDALKRVANGKINIQLACAEAWRESRKDNKEFLEEKLKPFDWTFTTDYMGTLTGFEIEDTDERIDIEKLKVEECIRFYVDETLFEDELHDNGIAALSVKMRVMTTSFFILLRYFLRIDNVMIRLNDTRIYHEFGKNYLLREYTTKEAKVKEINVHPSIFIYPSYIEPHLPVTNKLYHKLIIPSKDESPATANDESTNSTDTS